MHILLTGGTGLIGRKLCQHWVGQGHQLTVLSRQPGQVKQLCGASVRGVAQLEEIGDETVDAVVNLAGAPIADRPWTAKRRALLWSSRITLTERLSAWLESRAQRPEVLISGSAVGWYGDGGERELNETRNRSRKTLPVTCASPGKKPPCAPKPWVSVWCWCVPGWYWPARAAFSSV